MAAVAAAAAPAAAASAAALAAAARSFTATKRAQPWAWASALVRVSEAAKVACWRSRFAAASALRFEARASARRLALPSSVAARLARACRRTDSRRGPAVARGAAPAA